MNRYGIPKEDSKELKNNINNSSSRGGSSGEYYLVDEELISQYISNEVYNIEGFILVSSMIKATPIGKQFIGNTFSLNTYLPDNVKVSDIIAIKTDKFLVENIIVNFKEFLYLAGLDTTNFDKAFPRITEEEFYDLNKWSLEDYK